jgi:hypothetical protein
MKMFRIFSFYIIVSILSYCSLKAQNFQIGQHFQGGKIFYIDDSGKHGLIAAEKDQAVSISWGRNGWTGANSLFDGLGNTQKIFIFSSNFKGKYLDEDYIPPFAACICDSLTFEGYGDWYLPSINELKIMYEKQNFIGNFVLGEYCSSTECQKDEIWNVHFRPHRRIEFHYHKNRYMYNVRCIRKF